MTSFIGIDVGTGSARAGVFSDTGQLLGAAQCAIAMWRPAPDFAQHSSADIWASVCSAVSAALAGTDLGPDQIGGIGFDATCSLVVEGQDGAPVSVDPGGDPDQDIIVWMDHRAMRDADDINRIGGAPLSHVGERISPEMQLPKLRWLKRHAPEAFGGAARFWDLPDWLVHRATGTDLRSLCSAVCKWTYLGHKGLDGAGWDDGFLTAIGLEELTGPGHDRIGTRFLPPGARVGGLDAGAARELGLREGTPVGASMIDAHAGALGTLGVDAGAPSGRLAMIAGTSNCLISVTREPSFVPGVWGPYFGALLPDLWINEGGQTAAGALIDAVLARHSATAQVALDGRSLHDVLADRLEAMDKEVTRLTARRHVLPDFHGNRSPLAQPWRLGGITGLSLETGVDDLALDYLATLQGIGYGARHIIEAMSGAGQTITEIVVSGGLARNPLFLRQLADICGRPVLVPDCEEPVLLGAAMLGAVASGRHDSAGSAMQAMAPKARRLDPKGGEIAAYHDRKYAVHRRMQDDFAAIEDLMGIDR